MASYYERSVEPLLAELLRGTAAIFLAGPRATGKTTTAARYAATVVRLDRENEALAFESDPDAALRRLPEPVLLDEWQMVPGVLGAVKRTVDADPRPGRYILTGSVTAELEAQTWPGTGRLIRVSMHGLTVAEKLRRPQARPLLGRLDAGEELQPPADAPDLRGYVELALQGGFPEATFAPTELVRELWLESYVNQLITRDARRASSAERDPLKLRAYFEAYALNTAGILEGTRLAVAAGIDSRTAHDYNKLLTNLLVVEELPPWSSNRFKRLIRQPKRYVVDPALLSALIRVDVEAVMRDGDLLGRVLDTFVAAELRAQEPVDRARPRLYHLRQAEGRHEVDLVAELRGRQVVGIEVKAAGAPRKPAAKHLMWMRDALGDRFLAGVVLHTGPRVYQLDDRIIAAPIGTLWA